MSSNDNNVTVHGDNNSRISNVVGSNVVGNNGVINTGSIKGNVQNGAPGQRPSPFSAAGQAQRAAGMTQQERDDHGIDAFGHPSSPQVKQTTRPSETQGKSRPGGTRGQSISQLAQSIGSMELSNQDDLHAFCEAYRAILNYLAVTAKLADGQLRAAARANARQAKDGWLSPAQAVKLAATLKMVGRDLDHLANACVSGAADAVKAWRRFEGVLDDIETSNSGGNKYSRPGGGRGSGFKLI